MLHFRACACRLTLIDGPTLRVVPIGRMSRSSGLFYGPLAVLNDMPGRDMKENIDKKQVRTERTLLRAAFDFCAADADVQKARGQWRELHSLHDPCDGVCCLPANGPRDEGFANRPAFPPSKWCEDCKRILSGAVDYQYALWSRRQAKVRMIRAYKKLGKCDR